ncbi:Uncharacterised protein, partial [Mycoplasmopsis edwardii]
MLTLIPATSAAWGFSPTDLNLNPHLVFLNANQETAATTITITNLSETKFSHVPVADDIANSGLFLNSIIVPTFW